VAERRAVITVLAGTNGAGRSSIAGAMIRLRRGEYYNPDEAARVWLDANPRGAADRANAAARDFGRRMLEQAIQEKKDFAFGTTLGGATIVRMLERAVDAGLEVRIWYAGLASVDLHLRRVRQRVKPGGHDIPEEMIRRRFTAGPRNLIRLMPRLAALRVCDNSTSVDLALGVPPKPTLVLHCERQMILGPADLAATPEWARPIVARAMELHCGRPGR